MRELSYICLFAMLTLASLLPAQWPDDVRAIAATIFVDGRAGVLLVTRDGRDLVADAHGKLGPRGPAATLQTLFDIGGLAETFTAAVVLRLAQNGTWSLDDLVADHLRRAPSAWRTLTIRHLLEHESGLPETLDLDDSQRSDRVSFLLQALSQPPSPEPGCRRIDSPLDFAVLAALIEQVSGRSFEQCVQRLAFEPAGLGDTRFVGDAELDRRRAMMRMEPGVDAEPVGDATQGKLVWGTRGAIGIVSTARDLAKWYAALHDDSVLDAEYRTRFWSVRDGHSVGGFDVLMDGGKPAQVWHNGRVQGFRSLLRSDEQRGTLVVALATAGTDLEYLDRRMASLFASDNPEGAVLERYVGAFRVKTDEELEVRLVGEELVLCAFGQESASRLRHGQSTMPEWPRFYDEVQQRANVLMRPLWTHDDKSFRRGFHPEAKADAADSAIALVAGLESAHGKLGRVRLIGTSAAVGLVTYYEVSFGAVPVTLQVTWHGEKLAGVARGDVAQPFTVPLHRTGDGEFKAATLDGKAELMVTIRDKDLLLRDKGKAPVRAKKLR